MSSITPAKRLVIAGYGPGLGAAIADRFALAGYDVVAISRHKPENLNLPSSEAEFSHYECDLTDAAETQSTLAEINLKHSAPTVVIVNTARLLIAPFSEISGQDFEDVWKVNCLSAFHCASNLIPAMLENGGTIIFTGATAAIRGGANFSAFASSKFALRGLAQSLAREYGPQGLHIVHSIIDGLIWGPQTIDRFDPPKENCLHPDDIAESYLTLTKQRPSAWTHEVDFRPFCETF